MATITEGVEKTTVPLRDEALKRVEQLVALMDQLRRRACLEKKGRLDETRGPFLFMGFGDVVRFFSEKLYECLTSEKLYLLSCSSGHAGPVFDPSGFPTLGSWMADITDATRCNIEESPDLVKGLDFFTPTPTNDWLMTKEIIRERHELKEPVYDRHRFPQTFFKMKNGALFCFIKLAGVLLVVRGLECECLFMASRYTKNPDRNFSLKRIISSEILEIISDKYGDVRNFPTHWLDPDVLIRLHGLIDYLSLILGAVHFCSIHDLNHPRDDKRDDKLEEALRICREITDRTQLPEDLKQDVKSALKIGTKDVRI